jgi:hypothetical protein
VALLDAAAAKRILAAIQAALRAGTDCWPPRSVMQFTASESARLIELLRTAYEGQIWTVLGRDSWASFVRYDLWLLKPWPSYTRDYLDRALAECGAAADEIRVLLSLPTQRSGDEVARSDAYWIYI